MPSRLTEMDEEELHPTSHLFTVRLWLEPLGHERSEWRGEVKYVLTGEAYYFQGWAELQERVQRLLEAIAPPAPASAGGRPHE